MKRPILIAVALVVSVSAASSATANFIPWLRFDHPGDTYDPITLTVLGNAEGAHSVKGPMPRGGLTLTASGTHLRDDLTKDLGGGIGLMPFLEQDNTLGLFCSPDLGAADSGEDTVLPRYVNPKQYAPPTRNGVVAVRHWKATGCADDWLGTIIATWPMADGTTTWTVSKFRHVVRPEVSHRIWQGTDAFVNVCINGGQQTRSSGGRLYCTVSDRARVDRTTYRLTQRTTINKRYPAYVAP